MRGKCLACPSDGARNMFFSSSVLPGADLDENTFIKKQTIIVRSCTSCFSLLWLPCSLSSVMILLVWFHVLSMKTTLCKGNTFDSSSVASASGFLAAWVPSSTSSIFNLFGRSSSKWSCNFVVLLSPKQRRMSFTEMASEPGNTSTTWRGQRVEDRHTNLNWEQNTHHIWNMCLLQCFDLCDVSGREMKTVWQEGNKGENGRH